MPPAVGQTLRKLPGKPELQQSAVAQEQRLLRQRVRKGAQRERELPRREWEQQVQAQGQRMPAGWSDAPAYLRPMRCLRSAQVRAVLQQRQAQQLLQGALQERKQGAARTGSPGWRRVQA